MAEQRFPGLRVVGIRYSGSRQAARDERSLDAYAESDVYTTLDVPATVVEPRFPEVQRADDPTDNLGVIGGEIAQAVAAGRRDGNGVLVVGGDCSHITGVLGGLQDAHGPGAKIGLVWFDAHGDFNTPKTTLSGMLGGMPVAVAAGLAYPRWREMSHMAAALPTDRIVMVDVRNLDAPEADLIKATDIVVTTASDGTGPESVSLKTAVDNLAGRCDYIYLHIDSDILDERYVPNHRTREPNGPSMEQVERAIDTVMATGKVAAYAVVSVYGEGDGYEVSQSSGIEMLRSGLKSWAKYGLPEPV